MSPIDGKPDEDEFPDEPTDSGPENQENQDLGEDDLLKMLIGESAEEEPQEQQEEEGPLDLQDKFITPDLVELPPKWFYEKVRDRELPKGVGITARAKEVLDKVYFEGLGRADLIKNEGIPSSSINFAFRRIREIWKLYKTGVISLDSEESPAEQNPLPGHGRPKPSGKEERTSATVLRLTNSTTTFKEIDRAIASFLTPQVERSSQFQDVMARIGMVTTYAMMQLGILDKTKFVTLARAVTEDPKYLYDYVVGQLDGLISVVDTENLKAFTKELMYLRQLNQKLATELEDTRLELEIYKGRLRDAAMLVAKMMDYLSFDEQVEVVSWYRKYKLIKGGGVLAENKAS